MEEKEELKLRTWGGARKGAGRKSNGSKMIGFHASREIVEMVEQQDNKSKFLNKVVELGIRVMSQQAMQDEDATRHDFSALGEMTMVENARTLHLPFLDRNVAAGIPIELGDREPAEQTDVLDFICRNRDMSGLMRIKGNSMIDAGIDSGDVVVIDFSRRKAEGREIALCELNGGYTAKRVRREGDTVYLVPANPDFQEIKVCADDDFRIWGIITGVVKRL